MKSCWRRKVDDTLPEAGVAKKQWDFAGADTLHGGPTAEALEQASAQTSVKRPRVVEELTERGDVEAIFVAEGGALQPDERRF